MLIAAAEMRAEFASQRRLLTEPWKCCAARTYAPRAGGVPEEECRCARVAIASSSNGTPVKKSNAATMIARLIVIGFRILHRWTHWREKR